MKTYKYITEEATSDMTMFWSRKPGNFINQRTGIPNHNGPHFTGTVRQWYGVLEEVIRETCQELKCPIEMCEILASKEVMTIFNL